MDFNGLHRLLTQVELAHLSALGHESDVNQVVRKAARNLIANETIPRPLFAYAEALMQAAEPVALLDGLKRLFERHL